MATTNRNDGRKAARMLALACALTAPWMVPPASAAEPLAVVVDQATLVKLPQGVATIVVGNPLIADVALQSGGLMVVTGKGYGTTNLIVLDRAGKQLMDRIIEVRGPSDTVLVFRGPARESYSCAPNCERRITLGDAPDYFAATLMQSGTRNTSASATAAPVK
jgi:Flp pilus assembly secretin CpaC